MIFSNNNTAMKKILILIIILSLNQYSYGQNTSDLSVEVTMTQNTHFDINYEETPYETYEFSLIISGGVPPYDVDISGNSSQVQAGETFTWTCEVSLFECAPQKFTFDIMVKDAARCVLKTIEEIQVTPNMGYLVTSDEYGATITHLQPSVGGFQIEHQFWDSPPIDDPFCPYMTVFEDNGSSAYFELMPPNIFSGYPGILEYLPCHPIHHHLEYSYIDPNCTPTGNPEECRVYHYIDAPSDFCIPPFKQVNPPQPSIEALSEPICSSDPIELQANSGFTSHTYLTSYEWFKNGVSIKSVSDVGIYDVLGIYPSEGDVYTVTITNGNEEESYEASTTYTIGTLTSPLDFDILGADKLCLGESDNYTVDGLTTGYNIEWYEGDNYLGTGSQFTLAPEESGLYSVIATAPDMCTSTQEFWIEVNEPFELFIDEDAVFESCPGETIELSVYGGYHYVWDNLEEGNTVSVSPTLWKLLT